MRSIEELSKLLYETVLDLIKLHSENSILIKKILSKSILIISIHAEYIIL